MSKNKPVQLEFPGGRSIINSDGSETPDPRPVALPVGFERPEPLQDLIRRLVQDRVIQAAQDVDGVDTFDEADDFVIDDDVPVSSPHEDNFDPHHLITRDQEIRSGTVRDRTSEEKEAASELLKKFKKPAPPVVSDDALPLKA